MDKTKTFEPSIAIPPAETLKEVLEDRGISLQELADMTNISYGILKRVIDAKKSIDPFIADALEKALDTPSSFWINLEKNYQKTLKRIS